MTCKLSLVVLAAQGNHYTLAPIAGVMPLAGDFVVSDFQFASKEALRALRIHYMTLGTPRHDARAHDECRAAAVRGRAVRERAAARSRADLIELLAGA